MCLEILGMKVAEDVMIAGGLGAAFGAIISGYALYVVAKVKHDYDVADAVNEARIAGEEYPEWKVQKAGSWYSGYKMALVLEILMAFIIGMAAVITLLYMGKTHGTIDNAAVALIVSIVGGWIVDVKVLHPIADNKFMKDVEQPLVDSLFQAGDGVTQADTQGMSPEMVKIIEQLKNKGII